MTTSNEVAGEERIMTDDRESASLVARKTSQWRERLWCWVVVGFEYAARATAMQLGKFDRRTAIAAKKFIKPIPYHELKQEIDLFCQLFAEPAVERGLQKFVESTDAQPYLP